MTHLSRYDTKRSFICAATPMGMSSMNRGVIPKDHAQLTRSDNSSSFRSMHSSTPSRGPSTTVFVLTSSNPAAQAARTPRKTCARSPPRVIARNRCSRSESTEILIRDKPASRRGWARESRRVALVVSATSVTPGVLAAARTNATTSGCKRGSPPVNRSLRTPCAASALKTSTHADTSSLRSRGKQTSPCDGRQYMHARSQRSVIDTRAAAGERFIRFAPMQKARRMETSATSRFLRDTRSRNTQRERNSCAGDIHAGTMLALCPRPHHRRDSARIGVLIHETDGATSHAHLRRSVESTAGRCPSRRLRVGADHRLCRSRAGRGRRCSSADSCVQLQCNGWVRVCPGRLARRRSAAITCRRGVSTRRHAARSCRNRDGLSHFHRRPNPSVGRYRRTARRRAAG
jgi:hypothetical protein